jgi:hypothetical protein
LWDVTPCIFFLTYCRKGEAGDRAVYEPVGIMGSAKELIF